MQYTCITSLFVPGLYLVFQTSLKKIVFVESYGTTDSILLWFSYVYCGYTA